MTLLVKSDPNIIGIIPAAGIGSRMKISFPKQYLTIRNKTLLEHAVYTLLHHPYIHEVIIVINNEDRWYHNLSISNDPRVYFVIGGKTRADSVMSALYYIQKSYYYWVLVHDAVRPCLDYNDLNKLLSIIKHTNIGGLLASPVRDTIKYVNNKKNIILGSIKRENLWHAMTPQLFVKDLLKNCLEKSLYEGVKITDESSAVEYCGYSPLLVPGRIDNIKVTHIEDLILARFFSSKINNKENI